jgi:tetratricopeptide (TPR) repeat protein
VIAIVKCHSVWIPAVFCLCFFSQIALGQSTNVSPHAYDKDAAKRRYEQALLAFEQGNRDEEISHYNATLAWAPDASLAYYRLGSIYIEKNDCATALQYYKIFEQLASEPQLADVGIQKQILGDRSTCGSQNQPASTGIIKKFGIIKITGAMAATAFLNGFEFKFTESNNQWVVPVGVFELKIVKSGFKVYRSNQIVQVGQVANFIVQMEKASASDATPLLHGDSSQNSLQAWKKPTTYTLLGVGVLGLSWAGFLNYQMGNSLDAHSTEEQKPVPDASRLNELSERFDSQQTLFFVSAGVGIAALALGAWWLQDLPQSVNVSVQPGAQGASRLDVSWQHAF